MIKVVESDIKMNASDYFITKLTELINEVSDMDDSIVIAGNIAVQQLAEKMNRYLRHTLRRR